MIYYICMEKLIFSNKYLKKEYSFEEPINQLDDQKLIKILKRENYRNDDSGLFVQSLADTSVSELFQIKVNVSDVGTFLINFKKDELNDDAKKSLIDDISKLKTKGDLSKEEQLEKIKNLLIILNKVKPIFITFSNNENTKISLDDFHLIAEKINLDFYVLLLTKPSVIKIKEIVDTSSKGKKTTKTVEIISFKDHMEDYIFFGVFSFILSFSFILGLLMSFNNNLICIFLFVITGLFFGIYSYAISEYISDFKKWSFDLQKIKFPLLLSISGIALGIGLGFLIGFFVIKPAEGVTIDYGLSIGISIPVSVALVALGMISGYCIYLLIKKIKTRGK